MQTAAQVPRRSRVQLKVVSAPGKARLVQGRQLTRPLAALGAVMVLLTLAALNRFRAEHG
jgi:hypothetical protein